MNLDKISEALAKRFQAPLPPSYKRRILFWYDDEGEFRDDLDKIDFGSAKLLIIDNNYFEIKYTLEVKDAHSHYVVYSPAPKPENSQNWLIDILLYSEKFHADRASIVMGELKIENLELKSVIHENISFFDNKARWQALKDLDAPLTSEREIQLAMMAVVCRCKIANFESILFSVFLDKIDEEENERFLQIAKHPGDKVFWQFVKEYLGCESESPTLKQLFSSLLLTVAAAQLKRKEPSGWTHFMLPKRNNARVLMDNWKNHKEHAALYDYLSEQIFHELELQKQMEGWPPEDCLEVDAFPIFDKIVIRGIVNGLRDDKEDYVTWLSWSAVRKTGHWHGMFADIYMALEAAINLFRFKRRFTGAFPQLSLAETMERYAADYYQADQLYRHFYKYYDNVTNDILKDLAPKIDNLYCNWFLENLTCIWSDAAAENMTKKWSIDGVRPQREFYRFYIKNNVLEKNDREKIFVIISDALRFEIAKELETELLKELRGETTLEYMLGSIPSMTALGMATLLPHKTTTFEENGKIYVDGIDSSSTSNRDAILKKAYPNSAAMKLNDLLSASKEEARELVRDCRVVYVYHNVIDAMGEKPETEMKLFGVADNAIREIVDAVRKIVNSLNTTNVIVTADHGFLFQKSQINESDKIEKAGIIGLIGNRRYLLAEKGVPVDGAMQIPMTYIFGADSNLVAYTPRGNIRFKHPGGIHYVHGGASLQEIVIPVLQYAHARKESRKAKEARKVDVTLTNTTKKITNNIFTLNFFQNEKVSLKMLPRTLSLSLWGMGDKEKQVSTEESIIADRDSDRAEERTFAIRLKLLSGVPNGNYVLRLFDKETLMEYQTIPFEVNVGIASDFDDF
ncbi:MAG: BREX-1 system phosphatase PglZ type A [Candidatus Omnitrophota bacterium]